jgi:hypothetical protein
MKEGEGNGISASRALGMADMQKRKKPTKTISERWFVVNYSKKARQN